MVTETNKQSSAMACLYVCWTNFDLSAASENSADTLQGTPPDSFLASFAVSIFVHDVSG